MKIRNLFITRFLLSACFLSAAFTSAHAQLFQLVEIHRAVANSAIGSAEDIGFWTSPDAYNTNHILEGNFSQSYTIVDPGSVYFTLNSTASQISAILATTNSLAITGQLGVNTAYTGSEHGAAVWNMFSYLTCTFELYKPALLTLTATNRFTSDMGVDGHDSFVGVQNGFGVDIAAFGESTTWGYSGLTNPASGTLSTVLTPGSYKVWGISGENGGGTATAHTDDRLTTFNFALIPLPTLNIQPTNSAVIISWPAAAQGFILKSTAVLAAPTWQTVTNVTAPVGDLLQVILPLPATNSERFFRLEH